MKTASYHDQQQELHASSNSDDLANATITFHWSDGRALHEDHMHLEQVSLSHEVSSLPGDIGKGVIDKDIGSVTSSRCKAGDLFGSWDQNLCFHVNTSTFNRNPKPGISIEPRTGRFYPRSLFLELTEPIHNASQVARIVRLNQDDMVIDLNHPLAKYMIDVDVVVNEVVAKHTESTSNNQKAFERLTSFTGLKACLDSHNNTDYGDDPDGLSRLDSEDDSVFYQDPRMVQHLDSMALGTLNRLYKRLLPVGGDVLDIMASHDSHLQGIDLRTLHVIGLNQKELTANHDANVSMIHDLNEEPVIMLTDESIDAVVCTVSIEYLTNPIAIIAEVRRVLRSGGIFIITLSNRWFPTKSIRIWSQLHEFERVGLVTQWLANCGFKQLHTYSERGQSRPEDDRYIDTYPTADPIHAVWGFKP